MYLEISFHWALMKFNVCRHQKQSDTITFCSYSLLEFFLFLCAVSVTTKHRPVRAGYSMQSTDRCTCMWWVNFSVKLKCRKFSTTLLTNQLNLLWRDTNFGLDSLMSNITETQSAPPHTSGFCSITLSLWMSTGVMAFLGGAVRRVVSAVRPPLSPLCRTKARSYSSEHTREKSVPYEKTLKQEDRSSSGPTKPLPRFAWWMDGCCIMSASHFYSWRPASVETSELGRLWKQ